MRCRLRKREKITRELSETQSVYVIDNEAIFHVNYLWFWPVVNDRKRRLELEILTCVVVSFCISCNSNLSTSPSSKELSSLHTKWLSTCFFGPQRPNMWLNIQLNCTDKIKFMQRRWKWVGSDGTCMHMYIVV